MGRGQWLPMGMATWRMLVMHSAPTGPPLTKALAHSTSLCQDTAFNIQASRGLLLRPRPQGCLSHQRLPTDDFDVIEKLEVPALQNALANLLIKVRCNVRSRQSRF